MSPLKQFDTATLLDMITEGVVLIQKNGRIAFANKSFAELSGVDNYALTGMLFTEFVARQDKQRVARFFFPLIQSSGAIKDTTEFSFKNRSGTEYPIVPITRWI